MNSRQARGFVARKGRKLTGSPLLPGLADYSYIGADTNAIKRFQQAKKLPATGTLNPATSRFMRAHNIRIGDPPRRGPQIIVTQGRAQAYGRGNRNA
jgi:peptidoglycan hydrolase-like protein with peptidoglycan-binding domain